MTYSRLGQNYEIIATVIRMCNKTILLPCRHESWSFHLAFSLAEGSESGTKVTRSLGQAIGGVRYNSELCDPEKYGFK